MTCALFGKLRTVYNGIFSAKPHAGCLLFKKYIYNMPDYFGKENGFEFGHKLVEILQMNTMHNLPHRAHVMTAF